MSRPVIQRRRRAGRKVALAISKIDSLRTVSSSSVSSSSMSVLKKLLGGSWFVSLRSQRFARELRRPRARFLSPDQRAPRSQRGPCGPVTRLNLRVVRFAEIGRCEQSYTDADARSAHTHQYRALPSHQAPTHECPRALAGLVIGWPLSSVA
jgi:hypothetical protein